MCIFPEKDISILCILMVGVKFDFTSESFQMKFSMYNSFSLQFDDWIP